MTLYAQNVTIIYNKYRVKQSVLLLNIFSKIIFSYYLAIII